MDVAPEYYTLLRKFAFATSIPWCLASGLIKISVVFFCRRISSRAAAPVFRRLLRIFLVTTILYTIFYTFVPFFICTPMTAYWDQVDIQRIALNRYKYKCLNEGALAVANCVLAAIQDFFAILFPTILCWSLQVSYRQKLALFTLLTLGYTTVIISGVRAWANYRMFFLTYDETWCTSRIFLLMLLELHIGIMCANAPALKFFVAYLLSEKSKPSNLKMSAGANRNGSFGPWVNLAGWKSYHSGKGNRFMPELRYQISYDKYGNIIAGEQGNIQNQRSQHVRLDDIEAPRPVVLPCRF